MDEPDIETPTCEYVSDEEGALDLDSERLLDDGTLVCEAEADRVVRGRSGPALEFGAIAVCDTHADYLVEEAELDWEDNALPLEKYARIQWAANKRES